MVTIKYLLANLKDSPELIKFYSNYSNKNFLSKRIECYIKYNYVFVAKVDEKIVGVLQSYIKEDSGSGLAEFEEVFVLEEYRHRGIALGLIKHAVSKIKQEFLRLGSKPRKVYLFVSANNIAGISLYKKAGFKQITKVGPLFDDNKEELFFCYSF